MMALVLAPALSPAAGALTLKQSISLALEHNRSLAVSASGLDRAEAEADIAMGQILPRADISTGVMRTDSPLAHFGSKLQQGRITAADFVPANLNHPGYINNYQSRLGLSMPVFAGGALWAGRAKARHHADAAGLTYEFSRQQLVYKTIVAYVQARQAEAQVEARDNAVKAATKRWQDAIALRKRGMAINSDVMDAHVHLLRSEVALNEARDAYAGSIEALQLVLGEDQGTGVMALDEPRLGFTARSLDELKAAEAARRQSRAAFLPQVSLMAAQEWNNERFGLKNRNSMIGATVNINLFAGGADRARMRAAESERISMAYRIEDKKQRIGNEIRQAWRSLQTAKQRSMSEKEALKQTSESLRIKSLRHAQGLEKTSDLLDAQVQLDASRVANIRSRYDVLIARAAVLLAAGELNEEVVQ